jgi:sec-independent protein translocase protein TatA
MGSFGFEEMLVVVVVAIILFGRDLPAMARKVGKWYFNLKRQLTDIKEELKSQIPEEADFTKDVHDISDDLKAGLSDAEVPVPPPPEEVPSPSAGLPGPDPSDPEYKPSSFDPARPTNGGPQPAEPPKEPAPPAEPAPVATEPPKSSSSVS